MLNERCFNKPKSLFRSLNPMLKMGEKNYFPYFFAARIILYIGSLYTFQHFPNSTSDILCSKICLRPVKSAKRKRRKFSVRNPRMQLKLENNEKAPRADNIHAQQQLIFPAELGEQFTSMMSCFSP